MKNFFASAGKINIFCWIRHTSWCRLSVFLSFSLSSSVCLSFSITYSSSVSLPIYLSLCISFTFLSVSVGNSLIVFYIWLSFSAVIVNIFSSWYLSLSVILSFINWLFSCLQFIFDFRSLCILVSFFISHMSTLSLSLSHTLTHAHAHTHTHAFTHFIKQKQIRWGKEGSLYGSSPV